MYGLTGSWRLIRLALRRDRIKLPIILIVLALVFMSSIAQSIAVYGSEKQQLLYARTSAPSIVQRVFAGPFDGPDLGAIVLNETFLFTAIAVAFMSTMTIVRHTRQNEEFGRSELIESGIVSRHASLVAALVVTVLANLVFGGFATLALLANDLPVAGSVGTGLAFTAVGITFAGIAAIAVQLADSARGANSFSAMAIGVAFMLRAIGDSLGTIKEGGLAVQSAWPTWVSPLGWSQLIHPYTQGNWWIFGLLAGLFAVTVGVAVYFMAQRDIGLGMIATRPGPARGARSLLSSFGLARRLQRGIFRGWAATVVVLGVTYGLIIKEFQQLLTENEEFKKLLGEIGGDVNKAFLGLLLSFMAVTVAGYAAQAILRMRSEEANGQLESVLGGSVGRRQWMLSHIAYVFLGIVSLMLLTGLSMGATYILSSGASWSQLGDIMKAALVQSTAVLAFAGFAVAAFSLLARQAIAIVWGGFAACLLVMQLGVLLKLPQWIIDLSPFGHLPPMPAADFKLGPVLGLAGAAIGLTVIGLAYFNHRDITTS